MADHKFLTIVCQHCGHKIDVPVYCGNRFCEICGKRRRLRVRRRLDFLLSNTKMPHKYRFKHLTLTIPSQEDCAEMTKYIIASFRRLRQRAYWKNNIIGGAYVLEITGRPHNWHVHIHALIISRWISWDKILKIWIGVSKGRGVYIQDIPPKEVTQYLTKYLSKPSVPDNVLDEVNVALKGTRLFSPFGIWHNLNLRYTPPLHTCEKCGSSCWYPLGLIYGDYLGTFYKEVPDRSPPVQPVSSEELVFDGVGIDS